MGAESEKRQATEDAAVKGKRDRSPNYPPIGFPTALELTRKIYDKEGRSDVPPDIAVKHLGYTSMNGRAKRVLSALKAYGLFSEQSGQLKISEHGRAAMVFPEGSPERQAALRELVMRPPIFQTLLVRFGEHLPSDDSFKARLITEFDFMDDAAEVCLRAFKESLQFSRSLEPSPISPAPSTNAPSPPIDLLRVAATPEPEVNIEDAPQKQKASWRTVFPVGKNVTVEITATAPLKAKQYDLLIKHVNLLKEAAAADEADAEEVTE
ncbi:thioredoxin domain-containing protein [Stigmatella hybrida]|uniref:hypothetical protein n=1 Tax=Stigmatella hybrida TaxID=394097 RepID=UPI001CDAEEE5|nr:hypothetical protein [Stigmatella hybrida]